MLLHWLCVTSSTFISRSCGSRLVSERIVNGFPFIYMREHCIRRCAKQCPFGSLWLDVILLRCLLAGEKRRQGLHGKNIQKQHNISKGKIYFTIYNSSKIIESNKFYFQKRSYMFEHVHQVLMIRKITWMFMLHYPLLLSLPTYISDLSLPSVNKEFFSHFLKCHNEAWFGPAMQANRKQCEHRQHKCRLSNASWRTTHAVLKGGEEEIIRASCSGWSESHSFL